MAQIARTIARALNLNEDLAEAIALGHDLGHTPFGHTGENELNWVHPGGFSHSRQSLRIVDQLEKEGEGLNLTAEVRQGIVSHSKPRGDFLDEESIRDLTLEGQICRLSDAVAYLNHDLGDAFRAGILDEDSLPPVVGQVLGRRHSERVNTMVTDVVASSWVASGQAGADAGGTPVISMSTRVRDAMVALREFMFDNVYMAHEEGEEGHTARGVVRLLYEYFDQRRSEIPTDYGARSRSEDEAVADYVSGMTDNFALRIAEKIQPGIGGVLNTRLI